MYTALGANTAVGRAATWQEEGSLIIHFIHSLDLCGVPAECEGPWGEHGEDTVLAFLSLTGFRETIKEGRLPRGSTRVVGTHEVTELVLEQSRTGL